MTNYVSPENNPQFFEQFYDKVISGAGKLADYSLVTYEGKIGLTSKNSWYATKLYYNFWGTSYDSTSAAQKILDLAKDTINKLTNPSTSLPAERIVTTCVAACRSCFAIQELVRDCRPQNTALDEPSKLQKELEEVGHHFLQRAASSLQVSRVRVACQHGLHTAALFLIEHGEAIEEAAGYYTPLLALAYAQNKLERCRQFIQLGADPKQAFGEKTKEITSQILVGSIKAGQEIVALKLVEAGAEVNTQEPVDGELPIHRAARLGFGALIALLLAKGADINALDRHGNTALHTACRALQVQASQLLVTKGCNVALKNHEGYSAFCLPSTLPDKEKKEQVCDFYQQIFKSYQLSRHEIADYLFLRESPKPFEVALLFQDEQIAKKYAATLSQKEFLARFKELKAKYPKANLDLIELCHLEISPSHYQKDLPNLRIHPPHRDIALNELLVLFDTVTFTNPQDPTFFDRQKIKSNNRALTAKELREQIVHFIARVNGKAELIGSSPPWLLIERCIKNCLIYFQDGEKTAENVRKKVEFFRELIQLQIGEHCAGEYFSIIQALYRKICKGFVPSFEDEIYILLAEHRERLLQQCVDPNKAHNLNDYNYLLNRLGKPLAIPGFETCEEFLDPHGAGDIEAALKRFKKLYTALSIQKDCIEDAILHNGALREKFEEWCLGKIPEDWGSQVKAKMHTMKQKGATNAQICSFLKEHGVETEVNEATNEATFEQAIDAIRKHCYLTCEVYDSQGKIRSIAISRLLASLEKPVFSSTKLQHSDSPTTFVDYEAQLINMITQ